MLTLAISFDFDGSHLPILGKDNSPYPISMKTNFARVRDRHTRNNTMPIGHEVRGQLDFKNVLKLTKNIEDSNNYSIVTEAGKFLQIVPTPNANNNPPTQSAITQEVYKLAVEDLRRDFCDLTDCLNETLNHNSLESCIANLQIFIRDYANENEFINILISTNDRRIEYLPFEETSFIKKLVGSRPFGVQFKSETYLQVAPNNINQS